MTSSDSSEEYPTSRDEVWQYILDNNDWLKYIAYNDDDIWSDVVLVRMQGIMENYDPALASVKTHVTRNLKWYVYKYLKRKQRFATEELPEGLSVDRSARERVIEILADLSDQDAKILVMRIVYEMTFSEIGEVLDVHRVEASKLYSTALRNAREC